MAIHAHVGRIRGLRRPTPLQTAGEPLARGASTSDCPRHLKALLSGSHGAADGRLDAPVVAEGLEKCAAHAVPTVTAWPRRRLSRQQSTRIPAGIHPGSTHWKEETGTGKGGGARPRRRLL